MSKGWGRLRRSACERCRRRSGVSPCACSGLATLHHPDHTTAKTSVGPGLKHKTRGRHALRDAAVYTQEVANFFADIIVKSKRLADAGFGRDYRNYKAHFDEHYDVAHAEDDKNYDPARW